MVFFGDDLKCPSLVLTEFIGGRPLGLVDSKGGDLGEELSGISFGAPKLGLTVRFHLNHPGLDDPTPVLDLYQKIREVPMHLTIQRRPIGDDDTLRVP